MDEPLLPACLVDETRRSEFYARVPSEDACWHGLRRQRWGEDPFEDPQAIGGFASSRQGQWAALVGRVKTDGTTQLPS